MLAFSTIEIQKVRREVLANTHHTIIDIKSDKSIISLTIDENDARQKFLTGYIEAQKIIESINSSSLNEGWEIHDISL